MDIKTPSEKKIYGLEDLKIRPAFSFYSRSKNLQNHVDGDTWVQEFDFSFKPFILSETTEFKFSIVHPKKLNLHEMIATKQGFDQVEINEKVFKAQKVKVTLRGFKKMFWHADLWYEQGTGDLLMYKANEGPNTPTSVITLFAKQFD